MDKLPKIMREIGFDFKWDNKKVWNLDLPIEEMDMKELEWHLEIPFWNKPKGHYNLTPNEVLHDPIFYSIEFERIMNSDLTYPLDVMFWKRKWLMLDGLHRLVKARQLGKQKIKVRKIPQALISKIRK